MEDSPPHTLHLIQPEKVEEKEVRSGQNLRQEEEDPELEQLVDRARLVMAAQFYDKNEKAGLIEIKPVGENRIKPSKAIRSGIRPKPENIPPWSKDLIEKHTGKVKETLILIRRGKDEAEIFVGNNTKERNEKELITGMLQEHLQKLNKVFP